MPKPNEGIDVGAIMAKQMAEFMQDADLFARTVLGVMPDPQQKRILQAISRPGAHVSVRSGHGVGKAHPKDLLIDTPDGVRKWGSIRVGDYLWGSNGTPTEVVAVYQQGTIPIFRVTFDDRSSTVVSGEHLWAVRGRQHRRKRWPGWSVIPTRLLVGNSHRRNGVATAKQWEIPSADAVRYPFRSVPVHPYVFGMWLGDGDGFAPRISCGEPELVSKIVELHSACGVSGMSRGTCSVYLRGVITQLRSMGALGHYAESKFIPSIYMENDITVRSDVLRGLLDSDGEVTKSGVIVFSSTSRRLVDDVLWLARSLGGKALLQQTTKSPAYRNSDGKKMSGLPCYRATLRMPVGRWFYLSRKQNRLKDCEHRYRCRWIDTVVPCGESECMCVTVAADDGLYLANDFIVTHNTAVEAWTVLWFISCFNDCRIPCTAPTAHQLNDILWPEIAKWRRAMRADFGQVLQQHSEKLSIIGFQDDAFAVPRTARKENPDALQGFHATNLMYIVDEASGIEDVIFEAAEGALSSPGARILMAGNPTKVEGYFARSHGKDRSQWVTLHLSCEDSTLVDPLWVKEMEKKYGRASNVFKVRVLGEFPTQSDDTLIPIDWITSAIARDISPTGRANRIAGLDIARFGDDANSLVVRGGPVLMYADQWQYCDLMETCGKVVKAWKENLFDAVYADVIGLGAGVVDRLKELGVPVVGVNVAESPAFDQTGRFVRLRDQLWWGVREWFQGLGCRIEPGVGFREDLAAQLTTIRYGLTSDGKLKIEGKDEMKKRGLVSPNLADALCMTFAPGPIVEPQRFKPKKRRVVAKFDMV